METETNEAPTPVTLLVHDGDLCDVRDILSRLGTTFVERRGGLAPGDREARWDLARIDALVALQGRLEGRFRERQRTEVSLRLASGGLLEGELQRREDGWVVSYRGQTEVEVGLMILDPAATLALRPTFTGATRFTLQPITAPSPTWVRCLARQS